MQILKKILIGFSALIVILVAVAFVLPRTYTVERALVVNAPPSAVYPLVAAPKNWARWGVWNKRDPNMTMTYSGPDVGKGAKWAWQSKSEGDGSMHFVESETNQRLAYELVLPEMNMLSRGVITFEEEAVGATPASNVTRVARVTGATRVTWRADGDLGNNPIARYFGLFMDRMVGGDFAASLASLKPMAEAAHAAASATTSTPTGTDNAKP
jgi:uncharacterized protein YndB with AHSA1/START domain